MTMRLNRGTRPRPTRRRRHLKPAAAPAAPGRQRRRGIYSYAVLSAEARGAEVQR